MSKLRSLPPLSAFLLSCLATSAQTPVLTGKVADSSGHAIQFANIKIKGAGKGVSGGAVDDVTHNLWWNK